MRQIAALLVKLNHSCRSYKSLGFRLATDRNVIPLPIGLKYPRRSRESYMPCVVGVGFLDCTPPTRPLVKSTSPGWR